MTQLKQEKLVRQKLADYNLEMTDLTDEQLQNLDDEIDYIEHGGLILDGMCFTLHKISMDKAKRKWERDHHA